MKLFWVILLSFTAAAQRTGGLTNQIDSSYSTYKAWLDTRKSHPDITIVGEFKDVKVNEQRNQTYVTLGQTELKFDAFWPKENGNGVGIVIIHGGGWRTGNRSQHIPLAQKLASLGYSCFTVEYRLSTHALFPAAVQDIKAAISYVKKHATSYGFLPEKTVAMGFSAGGQLAALVGSTNGNTYFEHKESQGSSAVAACIDLDGILAFIHPESGEGDDSKRISAATHWFGCSKIENPELWKKGSALTYVGKNTVPCLFINSSVDRMHAGREDFVQVLSQNNIYVKVKTFEGSPHSFVLFEPWFTPMVAEIDSFLNHVF